MISSLNPTNKVCSHIDDLDFFLLADSRGNCLQTRLSRPKPPGFHSESPEGTCPKIGSCSWRPTASGGGQREKEAAASARAISGGECLFLVSPICFGMSRVCCFLFFFCVFGGFACLDVALVLSRLCLDGFCVVWMRWFWTCAWESWLCKKRKKQQKQQWLSFKLKKKEKKEEKQEKTAGVFLFLSLEKGRRSYSKAVLLLGTHFGCPDKWDARPPRVELRATSWPVCIFLGNTFWYREKKTPTPFLGGDSGGECS